MNNAYFKSYIIAIQDKFSYRGNTIIGFFTDFLYNYAVVAIWYAIVHTNQEQLEPGMVEETIKYMILAATAGILFQSISKYEIATRVSSGEIGRDLIYPISLPISLFLKSLGTMTTKIITNVIPTLLILTLIYRPIWNYNLLSIIGLLIGGLMGYYLLFLINLAVDMISFWWLESFYFHYIKDALFNFLSGSLVPLWFYPEWLYKIINILPFKNIVYSPIAFYLGKISQGEFFYQLALFLFWLVFMTVVVYILWNRGIKKVVVQGG